MSRAAPFTILSLERYAKWLGLDPLHFAGGYSALRSAGSCNSIWMQYDWQDGNKASRHQLAGLVHDAEEDVALLAGYWPALTWISDEWHPYPQPHRAELYGTGLTRRGDYKPVHLKWGYVWHGGQRATDAIPPGDVTRNADVDTDGDGFAEWASFTIANVATDFDPCQLRAYFKTYVLADAVNTRTDPLSAGADPAWEVRPITATLSGAMLSVMIPRWCLFRPQLQEAFNAAGINADAAASYVDTLSFYREYNDPETQVQFLWGEPGCQTAACATSVQAGCFTVPDPRNGTVVPRPGSWDAGSGTFTAEGWTEIREPDSVQFWYRAGYKPEVAPGCDLLNDYWANLIAILATARLERPLCTCSAAQSKVDHWRMDITRSDEVSFQLGNSALECPLGHRRGEVYVWQNLSKRPGLLKGRAVEL